MSSKIITIKPVSEDVHPDRIREILNKHALEKVVVHNGVAYVEFADVNDI